MSSKPTRANRLAAYGILASASLLGLALAITAIRLLASFA